MVDSVPERTQPGIETDQLHDLDLLYETSAAFSSSLDIDWVLRTTAQRITSALGIEGCTICAWHRQQDTLVTLLDYASSPGLWEMEAPGTTYTLSDLPTCHRALTGRCSIAVRLGDPAADPIDTAWMDSQGIKSMLIVPLMVRGGAIGLLKLYAGREEHVFAPAEISLCEALANQAAAALDNARLHAETEKQLRQQTALRKAAAAISSAIELETVLTRIVEQMAQLIDATSAYICGYDPESLAATVLAEHVGPQACEQEQVSDLGQTYPNADVTFMQEIISGRPTISDLRDPSLLEADRAHMEQYGAQTILYIPLRVQDRLLGFAELWESRRPRAFLPEEIALCQDIAQQAAIALDNARLYEQAQMELGERRRAERQLLQRNRELTLLNRVIAASAAYPTVNETLELVCRELALAFDVPQAAASMFNDARIEAKVVAEYLEEGRPKSMGATMSIAGSAFYEFLIEHKAPLVVEEAQTDPRLAQYHRLLQRRGTVSLLIAPILIDGEVVGSLGLEAIEPRTFHPEEVYLTQRVAEQVSGCLTRARLQERQQQLEGQLRQMHKMEALGHMAGGIAHDFNNLLTIIHISAQLLERKITPDNPLWEPLAHIKDAGQRAAGLTSRLLSFSRREVIQPRRADLNHMITSLRSSLKRITGGDVELAFGLSDGLWPIRVDLAQMDQVIVNLVVNARAALPDGGFLTIETKNTVLDQAYAAVHLDVIPGDYVELAISDTGMGLDEQAKAHLFEPFFTTRDGERSSGMELATVYGIVTQNKGHIRVYSEKTLGTTIRIYLPRAREAGEPAPVMPPAPITSVQGTETILLAEDEASVLKLAAQILKDHGYQVLTASNGLEALEVSQRYNKPIDLLLTDVVMPHMNGRELADELLLLRPETRVLYMSGYTDNVIMRHGVLGPDMAFIAKPLSLDSLARKVRAVLDR